MKFPVKIRDIHKIKKKKRIPSTLMFLAIKNKEKHPIYVSKKRCEEKYVDLLLRKRAKFLSKISIHSCRIVHYIVEENISVVIVCKLLKQ